MRFDEAIRDRELVAAMLFIALTVAAVLVFHDITFPWFTAVFTFLASVPAVVAEGVTNLLHLFF